MSLIGGLFRRKQDAMISFPKSGRTWLRIMLDELGIVLHYKHAQAGHVIGRHFSELDTSVAGEFNRIVFLHRDPRDTAVSGYYQKDRRLAGYDGTISDFIRDPCHGIEKIGRYNAMWRELAKRRSDMIAVAYEDVRANPQAELGRIVAFLGHRIEADRLARVIENNTFERVRARELAGEFDRKHQKRFGAPNPDDPNSLKARRGKIGGYRDELSAVDIAYCDSVMASLTSTTT